MSEFTKNLAVQSWCFRNFAENTKVAELVKGLGLNGIEICGKHCDFNNPAGWDGVIDTYKKAGIRIVSIGVESFGADESASRKRFEFAQKAGCKMISANFNPFTYQAALPIVYKLSEEFDIKLAIHNHGGYHWLGSGEILNWVFATTRTCIGLNMDTAWALDAKQNPVEWAEKFASRLYAVHIKDFVFDRVRKPTDVIVGTGGLDLPGLMKTLKAKGFAGEMILEYEGDVENPVPKLAECVKAVHAAG